MLLAGEPFYISPAALWEMTANDILVWLDLAAERITIEKESIK